MFIRLKDGHFLNLALVLSVEKQTNGDLSVKFAVPRPHTDVMTETIKGESANVLLDALESTAWSPPKEPLIPTPSIAAAETGDQTGGPAATTGALGAGSLTGGESATKTGKEGELDL